MRLPLRSKAGRLMFSTRPATGWKCDSETVEALTTPVKALYCCTGSAAPPCTMTARAPLSGPPAAGEERRRRARRGADHAGKGVVLLHRQRRAALHDDRAGAVVRPAGRGEGIAVERTGDAAGGDVVEPVPAGGGRAAAGDERLAVVRGDDALEERVRRCRIYIAGKRCRLDDQRRGTELDDRRIGERKEPRAVER